MHARVPHAHEQPPKRLHVMNARLCFKEGEVYMGPVWNLGRGWPVWPNMAWATVVWFLTCIESRLFFYLSWAWPFRSDVCLLELEVRGLESNYLRVGEKNGPKSAAPVPSPGVRFPSVL
jgi:hypothetical protein